jgi:hypothetical protein
MIQSRTNLEETAMTRHWASLAAALAIAGCAAPAAAADAWLGGSHDGTATLSYGDKPPAGEQPNPETVQLSLSCKAGSGVVRLFVAESAETLKPGTTARLTLTAAEIASTVNAKVLPNQLAGVPSLQAAAPAGLAVFNALARLGRAGRGSLRLAVGTAWRAAYPLKTMGGQADAFFRACAPKAR